MSIKNVKIFLVIWVLLQIPRLIAIPLIKDVLDGVDSPAWMFPAILDIVVAISAPFIAYGLWFKKGLGIWVMTIIFFVVSIIDHLDAATAGWLTPTPQIFGGDNSDQSKIIVPLIQMIIDVLCLFTLSKETLKKYYITNLK